MDLPSHSHVPVDVYARGGFDLTTHDGCGIFTEAVVVALHQLDPNWGHLRKSGAQTQYNGHAIDSALYKPLGQSVDFIGESQTSKAYPAWSPDIPRYGPQDWFAPPAPPDPIPIPAPAPVDYATLDARLAKIEQTLNAISVLIAQLPHGPRLSPIYRGSALGIPIVLKPDPII